MTTQSPGKHRLGGFTMVEVLVSAFLMGFILVGVLTTFLFMGRSGYNLSHYSDMESSARKALEVFAEDVRQASVVTWSKATADQQLVGGESSPVKVTLSVNGADISYAFDPSSKTFVRQTPAGTVTLLRQVDAFQYTAYQIVNPAYDPEHLNRTSIPIDLKTISTVSANGVTADKLTKQIQISLRMSRTRATLAAATNSVLSARYILRNKLIVN